MKLNKKIYPCLWFDNRAKEAAKFYCSIFEDGRILETNPVVTTFEIAGTKFMGLNGGPEHRFTPATSFVIECDTQHEIDYCWEKLGAGGRYGQCGWLDDKYGVSWQIVPAILGELMSNPEKAPKVAALFSKMTKFEIEPLLNA